MRNPDFIQKLLEHYKEEQMPVPGSMFRYISTDRAMIKFRDKREVSLYLPIRFIDAAKSRHDAGQRILGTWVRMVGNKDTRTTGLVKALLKQFP